MNVHSRTLSTLALAGILALASPAWAQEQDRDRVQSQLELTDRRIEQAEAVVAGSDDARAVIELQLAVDLQGQARRAFGQGQYMFTGRLTLEARGHADRAIGLVRGPDPDVVAAQLERTRDLLERGRERIEACDDQRARAVLRTAFEMQVRAERASADGRYLAALQLSLAARQRAVRSLRLCNLEENLAEGSERALRRTDDVLARASEAVQERGADAARMALGRANEVQERAWREFRAERHEVCLRLTQQARAYAHRALRLASGG